MKEEFDLYSPELLAMFKKDMEKGNTYHAILENFTKEHPEVVEVIAKEQEYFPYIFVKLGANCPELYPFLAMSEPVKSELKSLFDALILQGYYRCYQKLVLEKMK
jgi:hypothetical protein